MSVYKRGGIWYVRFEKAPFGEVRRSSGSTRKADAIALEIKLKEELRQRVVDGKLDKPNARLWDDAVIRFMESGAPASWTPKLRQIRPWMDGISMDAAPAVAMDMKADLLKSGLSPCTINRRLAAVKRILRLAFREWNWLEQPLDQRIIMCSEKGTAREVYLTQDEVAALFQFIEPSRTTGTASAEAVKIALLLLCNTGLRVSEARRLTPADWQPPNLIVRRSKSGKPRAVPVHPIVHWICDEHLPLAVNANTLRYWWEKGRRLAGLEHVRMHDLRHAFASWYAANPEATMAGLRDVLGHSNLAVTSRYAHLMQSGVAPVGLDLIRGNGEP